MECPRCASGSLRVVRTVRGETLSPPEPYVDFRRLYCTDCRIFVDTVTAVTTVHPFKKSELKTHTVRLNCFLKFMEGY
jgi:hypothetical protein